MAKEDIPRPSQFITGQCFFCHYHILLLPRWCFAPTNAIIKSPKCNFNIYKEEGRVLIAISFSMIRHICIYPIHITNLEDIMNASKNNISVNQKDIETHEQQNSYNLIYGYKIPLAVIAGLRVESVSAEQGQVSLPMDGEVKPFRSIYFAAQSMAAEMSTGVLGQCLYSVRIPVCWL